MFGSDSNRVYCQGLAASIAGRRGAYFDLVHVADRMVEFNGASLFHVGLLSRGSVRAEGGSLRGWGKRVSDWGMPRRRPALARRRPVAVKRRALAMCLIEQSRAVLRWGAELLLGAFDAGLDGLRPVSAPLAKVRRARPRGCLRGFRLHVPPGTDRMESRARRCRDADAVGVVLETTFDPIARWEESVEALDEVRMAGEQIGDATNDTRCIDSSIPVSFLRRFRRGDPFTYVWLLKSFIMSRKRL